LSAFVNILPAGLFTTYSKKVPPSTPPVQLATNISAPLSASLIYIIPLLFGGNESKNSSIFVPKEFVSLILTLVTDVNVVLLNCNTPDPGLPPVALL